MTPNDLFASLFGAGSTPRSVEYRAGCLAALRYRAGEAPAISCHYPIGTVQADAWLSGWERGKAEWRKNEATLTSSRLQE